ncbi:hypothetical protein PInf_023392 [Phytophthora infestans]|nr:hypothetical protein PInf_023392 [Phytophthora infestans]
MDDGVTAVEAVVERETLTVSDTVETVEDAERLVVERKTADLCGTTEVFVAETMAEEVCEPAGEDEDVSAKNDSTDCVVALTERDTLVDEDEEEFWDAVESVSEMGEIVFAAWTLKDDPNETASRGVAQEVIEEAVEGVEATVPELGEVVSDLSMTDGDPEAKYSRLFSDLGLEAMEGGDPDEEERVLIGVNIAAKKEAYDKELEERLVPLDEVELTRQMKVNAETTKDPSLEDMAKYLGIPEEVLERVSELSANRFKRPEYWQEWFKKTLESSAEAKRANRDFR